MKSDNVKKHVKKAARPSRTKATSKTASGLNIPPILLEGDAPAAPAASGPGQRYALGPAGPAEGAEAGEGTGELPEAYGTRRLLLAARDPRWLYAHWDLTREQLKEYNARSADRHLVIRVYKQTREGQPCQEVHVHPESRNWFINVDQGGTSYLAELGYYQPGGDWVTISTSGATFTPPDAMAEDTSVWFETLPADLQFSHLVKLVRTAVSEQVPLMEAIAQLRAAGFKGLPDPQTISTSAWTPAQERALAELVTMDTVRRVWMGSLEITELIRRQLMKEISSAVAAQFSLPGAWSGELGSVSSPFGAAERRKGFWFNINAELIIYGATEPDAEVTIGGRVIKLRPDGTFSYRFALPDGKFDLPAIATSADGTDSRSAELRFSRATHYRGEVGRHPQDAKLKPPLAEHVA